MYICKNCGHKARTKPLICPSCSELDTFIEEKVGAELNNKKTKNKAVTASYKPLKEVNLNSDDRYKCGIGEVDRVMGGGFVSDSVNIITAPPGQGKSTLLLSIANHLADLGKTVLYISSEESSKQIKSRANRVLKDGISDNLYICDTKESNNIKPLVEQLDADVVILDSISSFRSDDIASPAGSVTQVRNVSDIIIELCKGSSKPRMSLIVAHVTKDDELSGARSLEHDVDAVMYLEGERDEELRILRTVKNRFGELDTGLFIMTEDGLKEISNLAEYFTTKRDNTVPGVALSMVKEGSRNIVIEIEALVSKTNNSFPTRIASCLRRDNLNILLSIIEQKLKLPFYYYNAIVNSTGRIKLSNSSTDLAIVMALISSFKQIGIANDIAFIGEVSLTGELKRTMGIEKAIKELDRLNYKKVYVPKGNYKNKDLSIEVIECRDIEDVCRKIFD